jgi:hypothetical protein
MSSWEAGGDLPVLHIHISVPHCHEQLHCRQVALSCRQQQVCMVQWL